MTFEIIIIKINKFITFMINQCKKFLQHQYMYYFHINQFTNNWDEQFPKHQTVAV